MDAEDFIYQVISFWPFLPVLIGSLLALPSGSFLLDRSYLSLFDWPILLDPSYLTLLEGPLFSGIYEPFILVIPLAFSDPSLNNT